MYEFVYLKIMLVALGIWTIAFLSQKQQRKEMLTMGTIAALLAPIHELWYTKDYWHPQYVGPWPWIEDILFGFAVMGIATVFYEMFFAVKERKTDKPHPFVFWALVITAAFGMGIFVPFMNSIYAASVAFVLAWIIAVVLRPDLIIPSLSAMLIMFVTVFVGYAVVLLIWPGLVSTWWELNAISGILFSGVPIEEYLWFGTMALALSPLYELWKGISFNAKSST